MAETYEFCVCYDSDDIKHTVMIPAGIAEPGMLADLDGELLEIATIFPAHMEKVYADAFYTHTDSVLRADAILDYKWKRGNE